MNKHKSFFCWFLEAEIEQLGHQLSVFGIQKAETRNQDFVLDALG